MSGSYNDCDSPGTCSCTCNGCHFLGEHCNSHIRRCHVNCRQKPREKKR